MARTVRDTKLETREARRNLKLSDSRTREPYWRSIDPGAHLGYYKGERGGSWVARLYLGGRYLKTTLGTADDGTDADGSAVLDYRQAQTKARDWFAKQTRKAEGLPEADAGPYSVADAMRDYLAHYKTEGKSLKATKTTVDAHILPALGETDIAKLTAVQIKEWHKALATAPARARVGKGKVAKVREAKTDGDAQRRRRATANRVLTVLKAALNYAWREGKAASDTAWRMVKPFKNVDAPVVRYLSEPECVRLVNATPADFRPLVRAALLTGCRYGELVALTCTDFNPDAGTLAIRTSKSGKRRHVVLTDEGQTFFASATAGKTGANLIFLREDGAAWGKSHQQRPLAEACKHAKIAPAISFHVLRHTHGSTLAMKGVPMPVIAKQLGHADTRMTERHYAHLSPSYVADTIRASFPKLGIVETENVATLAPRRA